MARTKQTARKDQQPFFKNTLSSVQGTQKPAWIHEQELQAEMERDWSTSEEQEGEQQQGVYKRKRIVTSDTKTELDSEARSAPWSGEEIPTNHRVTAGKTLPRGLGPLPSDEPRRHHGLLNAEDFEDTEEEPPQAAMAEDASAPYRKPSRRRKYFKIRPRKAPQQRAPAMKRRIPKALQEIRHYQKTGELLIRKALYAEMCRVGTYSNLGENSRDIHECLFKDMERHGYFL